VRNMQRNWIGRSEGVQMTFELPEAGESVEAYTTRPDTIMGASYMALAPEHPLARRLAEDDAELAEFLEECRHAQVSEAAIETMDKRGKRVDLSAVHPLTGEALPVWVANFVLMGYGTGAIMAVPAHDQRDWEFARRYGLPVRQVVAPADGSEVDIDAGAFTEPGVLVGSDDLDGLTSEQAFDAVAERLAALGRGGRRTNYRLRDWSVSRQRYWGAPIPVIRCGDCGDVTPSWTWVA